jgi:hypothetical protein
MPDYNEEFISAQSVRNRTIKWFLTFLIVVTAITLTAFLFYRKWHPKEQGISSNIPSTARSVLNINENIFSFFFSNAHKAKSFPVSAAEKKVRVNGDYGMNDGFDPAAWKLQLVRKPGDTIYIGLEEIKSLPKTDIIFDFKCIEGWSQVTHWAGVKFSDFVQRYGLDDQARMGYVGMHTPDNAYYVGIDSKSIMHPQTILCYEMNGQPLPLNQGAPLRLIIPVKYGVKHLKRIGTIFFSAQRPPDYWYNKGYDYYCGL